MIKFGTSGITDIFVGDKVVDKIYFGSDLKYQRTPPEEMLVFTGIDANGNYELDANYDGTPVSYSLGDAYSYYMAELITPTPTQASDYSGKYVYNESEQRYVQCTYRNSTLYPSWVEVGVTPAYNQGTQVYSRTEPYDIIVSGMRFNSMFNYKYFNNVSGADFYKQIFASDDDVPTLSPSIGDVIIPDTHNGLPVKQIFGFVYNNSSGMKTIFSKAQNRPTSINFGSNIYSLQTSSFVGSGVDFTPSTFVLNEGLSGLPTACLSNIFTQPFDLILPSSVLLYNSNPLGGEHLNGTVTITGNYDGTLVGSSGTSIIDNVTYGIINSTVTSITGYLILKSGSKVVFMHSANDPITLNLSKAKTAITADIYTDNPTVQNYDWAGNANVTPTFHPLSDYTGS